MAEVVLEELDTELNDVKFFSDSKVVLGYILNESRRFYVYAKRLRLPHDSEHSQPHEEAFDLIDPGTDMELEILTVQRELYEDEISHIQHRTPVPKQSPLSKLSPFMTSSGLEGTCSQMCYNIFIVETVCVAWFSLEFTLRFIQDRSKLAFLRRPLNLIDVMAILPYYITLAVDSTSSWEKRPGSGSSYLDKVGLVLRVLRALRILYVMRLARHSLGLQTLGLTARRCTREFGLLLLFLCVAIALFSPLLYLIENEMATAQEFSSIPATYWWAVITMTTVGYGDMVPRSIPGQVVALSSILSGILLMAFPVTSIFHTFSRSYVELKQEQQRLLQRRTHFLLRSRIAGMGSSDLSLESDMLFPIGSSEHRDRDD
ncbi:Potassium voltage-gated channel subfamily G member 1 [Merluccius polli]|uniref:Potassium voltage-gated channel subfamily G member 1 n=1 Tax=Merluccius polli TaxID=89951 RepID=A0AA47MXT7_MERPO|nr:Potassium voltage-gated channel subfamily G member 1 [Merluccius polli]